MTSQNPYPTAPYKHDAKLRSLLQGMDKIFTGRAHGTAGRGTPTWEEPGWFGNPPKYKRKYNKKNPEKIREPNNKAALRNIFLMVERNLCV